MGSNCGYNTWGEQGESAPSTGRPTGQQANVRHLHDHAREVRGRGSGPDFRGKRKADTVLELQNKLPNRKTTVTGGSRWVASGRQGGGAPEPTTTDFEMMALDSDTLRPPTMIICHDSSTSSHSES
jgi:hypothetical protein